MTEHIIHDLLEEDINPEVVFKNGELDENALIAEYEKQQFSREEATEKVTHLTNHRDQLRQLQHKPKPEESANYQEIMGKAIEA